MIKISENDRGRNNTSLEKLMDSPWKAFRVNRIKTLCEMGGAICQVFTEAGQLRASYTNYRVINNLAGQARK